MMKYSGLNVKRQRKPLDLTMSEKEKSQQKTNKKQGKPNDETILNKI